MKRYIILICIFLVHFSFASFISLNAGYDQFSTEKMSNNNAKFLGENYQFEIGGHMKYTIITFYMKKSDLNGKLLHDDIKYGLVSEQLAYGIKASFLISKKNYLALGFNVSKIENDFSGLSEYSKEGIKEAYKLEEDQETTGLILGIGRNFYKKRGISIFGEYNMVDHSNLGGKTHSIFFGLRFKTNINI